MDPVDPALQPVIVLRVVIRSPDLETFVSKYSRFLKDDRIFIFTKSSQPPGTRVRFTLELADGQPLIHGEGTVTRIRPDSGDVTKPPGMELRFQPLDERSRDLVAQMLRAREETGHFREENTDAQTRIRDNSTGSVVAMTREFDEHVPTLQPLERTGAQPSLRADPEPPRRQDESGAVTLAQAPPGERTSPDPPPPVAPAHPATHASTAPIDVAGDKQSGGFSTPTPLPAPIPAATDEFGGSPPPTKLARPSTSDALTTSATAMPDAHDAPFAAVGPAPSFAERFHASLQPGASPPATGAAPPTGTVPANPFSEVSDNAIEYFVEWSLEQSTAPKPKVAEAHFANVAMATPKAERRRSMRGPLLGGMAIGIFLGLPLGGAIVWYGRPAPAPIIVEKMPEVAAPPSLAADLATATAQRELPDLALPAKKQVVQASGVVVKPTATAATDKTATTADKTASAGKTAPAGKTASADKPVSADKAASADKPAADKPDKSAEPSAKAASADKPARSAAATETPAADKPDKSDKAGKAELSIVSHPAGASVTVDGDAQGKTPVTLQLPAGMHEVSVARDRYATVTQSVELPAKLDVALKRPTATLHVDSDPPGGEVTVEGKPRGKTPVDVTLEAFHHYDVQVTLLGTRSWKKRVSLKPPQTDVTAKLSVVRTP